MGRTTKSAASRPDWAKRLEVARLLTTFGPDKFAEKLGLEGERRAERYLKYERGEREPNVVIWTRILNTTGVSLDFIIAGKPTK